MRRRVIGSLVIAGGFALLLCGVILSNVGYWNHETRTWLVGAAIAAGGALAVYAGLLLRGLADA